ncbi:MAG: response regulator transcription factor [Bacteroidales bacterium]
MNNSPKVLIADGQYLTRLGIAQAVQSHSPGCLIAGLSSGEDLWLELKSNTPDILILDHDWMDFDVQEDLPEITGLYPALRILLVTEDFKPEEISRAWEKGVSGIVLKSSTELEFQQAFLACCENQRYLAAELVDVVMSRQDHKKNAAGDHPLTPSELEIVRLIGQGLTTKEIANQKHLSFHTIITHRRNIFKKLGINNSSELLMYAIRNGIIPTIDYSI